MSSLRRLKFARSLNSRLVLSHLAVSLASIVLMSVFAGRAIIQASYAEVEHNLQDLAFAAGNALEQPIQEYHLGRIKAQGVQDLLMRWFSDNPDLRFTVYMPDGFPIADSSGTLPPRANSFNAPEVIEALETELGRGVNIRTNAKGQTTLYTATLIQREIEVIGILRLAMPLQASLEAAQRSLLVLLAIALGIAGAVSLVGWVLANNLARPIQVLTNAAENMERGDLSVRVKPSGPQEMHRLAEAFNSMASRLQTNVSQLRDFVANASHELRTPLTVVKLRAEALREGALEDPEVAERFLGDIETEVDRLVRMVNDLLDLSRMEAGLDSGRRTQFHLGSIAREIYETFKMRASRAEVDLSLDIEPGLPPINGNEDQLRRVLINMVENAIKYTPAGGKVEILLRSGPSANTIRLLVRDTGPGIAPEHLPRVFERFYRAETSTSQPRPGAVRGSGLGLAIAKSIVENHGGQMGVSSQVGNGTTFWADLPAAV